MTIPQQVLAALVILATPAFAFCQGSYEIAPPADWIEPITLDIQSPPPFEDIQPGSYFRLVDVQSDADSQTTFSHFAEEILTGAGLQNLDELEIHFDPEFQTVFLHELKIHRDGEIIDILDPTLIRFHHRETELGVGIWNGTQTLLHFVRGVRVGDIIEHSYSVRGFNPVFEGKFASSMALEWETPVLHTGYRVRSRVDRQLTHRSYKLDLQPEIRVNGEYRDLVWSLHNTPGVVPDTLVPPWFDEYAWIQVSEFISWSEIANWGSELYNFNTLPLTEAMRHRLDDIRDEHEELDTQALEVIRWVSDEIRYLGLEEGTGAFIPRAPSKTLSNHFGDCKDKTVLLGRLLAELGIASHPMYVHSEEGRGLPNLLPSPLAFDHVILRLTMPDGRQILADPTYNQLGGTLDHLNFRSYHSGLILESDTKTLTKIAFDPLTHGESILEHDLILGDIDTPATLKAVTTYTGGPANDVRIQFSTNNPSQLNKNSLDFYRDDYPKIELKELSFVDDRDANHLVVHEESEIDDIWKADGGDPDYVGVHLYFNTIRQTVRRLIHPSRETPFELQPTNQVEVFRIHLPENYEWSYEPDTQTITGPGIEFVREVDYADYLLTIRAEYHITADHVSVKQLEDYYEAVAEMMDLTYYSVWLDKGTSEQESDPDYSDEENLTGYPAWLWTEQPPNPAMLVAVGILFISGLSFLVRLSSRSRQPPTLPDSELAELRAQRGYLGFVLFALVLIPIFSLAVIPFQSWHHFVHPYYAYEDPFMFTLESGLQIIVFAFKLIAALVMPIALLIYLLRWRQQGRQFSIFYFIGYPLLLLCALTLNLLQHPYPDVLLVSSSIELGVVALLTGLTLPYLIGSTRLRSALN